ncbi:hypothetical protein [Almyronema epifaneia]|uniref:Uncharacterized protein n=1 Tax=Almyronema epifaneia S1 TaxID=2991925 RepID=A0ABW6IDH3_9CYAN
MAPAKALQQLILIGIGIIVFGLGYVAGRQAIACPPTTDLAGNATPPAVQPDMTPTSTSPPDALINQVLETTAAASNVPLAELSVVRYSRETWPDGCLGLAEPDELCTQALVEGWLIQVSPDRETDKTWTYRTDLSGDRIRLAD